jgi:hypothetical protein
MVTRDIRRFLSRDWAAARANKDAYWVPLQPAAIELLAAVAPVLARWGRWYVFGAQAVIGHRVPRLSADVDVTVALEPDDPQRFAREMDEAGFRLRVTDPDFIQRTRVMPSVHLATGMPLDVDLAASGLEETFLDRAVVTRIGNTAVPLIEVGDLIIAKVLAGRPKDVARSACSRRRSARATSYRCSSRLCDQLERSDDPSLDPAFAGVVTARHSSRRPVERKPLTLLLHVRGDARGAVQRERAGPPLLSAARTRPRPDRIAGVRHAERDRGADRERGRPRRADVR